MSQSILYYTYVYISCKNFRILTDFPPNSLAVVCKSLSKAAWELQRAFLKSPVNLCTYIAQDLKNRLYVAPVWLEKSN